MNITANARPVGVLTVSLLLCLAFTGIADAAEIRIGGTGNALGAMQVLADAFVKLHPEHKVTVLPSIGSSGAIKAIPQGALEIGLSSRPLTDEEKAKGAMDTEYARSPTVFAISKKSAVKGITRDQIVAIYAGDMAQWPDGTPIRPVLRQQGDDNTRQIKSLAPAMETALASAERRPGLPFAVIDQEAADKIESVPGAIGVTTLALILSERRPLRALALDKVEPTVANVASGAYPLVKRFYLITKPAPDAAVRSFVDFLATPTARETLRATGHWIP